jgi:hypothetical protein
MMFAQTCNKSILVKYPCAQNAESIVSLKNYLSLEGKQLLSVPDFIESATESLKEHHRKRDTEEKKLRQRALNILSCAQHSSFAVYCRLESNEAGEYCLFELQREGGSIGEHTETQVVKSFVCVPHLECSMILALECRRCYSW